MNKIAFGSDVRDITKAYIEGARAKRLGLSDGENPYTEGAKGHDDWKVGRRNEVRCEHVRFGIDVVSASPRLNRTFEMDPDVPRDWDGNVDWHWHEVALMHASGAFEAGKRIGEATPDRLTPARFRDALRAEGFDVTTSSAETLSRRINHERLMEGEDLTPEEEEIVRSLSKPRRRLVLAMAAVQDRYYQTMAKGWRVSSRCNRSASWAAATSLKMAREGQGFMLYYAANGYCTLKEKGWTAARILRDMDAEVAAELDGVPSLRFG